MARISFNLAIALNILLLLPNSPPLVLAQPFAWEAEYETFQEEKQEAKEEEEKQQRLKRRLKEVTTAVGDTNGSNLIEMEELYAFLERKKSELLRTLREQGLEAKIHDEKKFDSFLDKETIRIFNKANVNNDKYIDHNELSILEMQKLNQPFSTEVSALLPKVQSQPLSVATEPIVSRESAVGIVGRYFKIRRSFLDGQSIGLPATLTITHYGDDDAALQDGRDKTNFQFQGAFLFEPFRYRKTRFEKYTLLWNPVIVYEADLSTDSKRGRNQIAHRVGFQGTFYENKFTQGLSGHNINLTFDYATDRNYDQALFGGTLQYSPNWRNVLIGEYSKPFWEGDLVSPRFRWRPYFGLAVSDIHDPGENEDLKKASDLIDGFIKGAWEIQLAERFRVTSEISYYKEFLNDEDDHVLYGIAGTYNLDQEGRFSLQLSYQYGEKYPDFVKQNLIQGSFGIKF